MTNILLGHKGVGITGRKIASKMNLIYRTTPKSGDIIVIRWGNSNHKWPLDYFINNPQAINLASNGIKSLQLLKEKDISSPTVYLDTPEKYPVMGRNKINHKAGTDIIFIETENDFVKCKYYTEYIPLKMEFRAHIIGGEVIKLFRKVERTESADTIIRTSKRGWGFVKVNHEKYYKKVQKLAINAANTLGLKFCGVDCGYDYNSNPVIIELNTAPSLNTATLELYVQKLKEVINA